MHTRNRIIPIGLSSLLLWANVASAASTSSMQENSLIVCLLLIFCASSIAFQLVPGLIRIIMILRRRYIDSTYGDGPES